MSRERQRGDACDGFERDVTGRLIFAAAPYLRTSVPSYSLAECRCPRWYALIVMPTDSVSYSVRDLDQASEEEFDTVVRWCMETVLSTIPEFEGCIDKARAALPNFSFEQMGRMIRKDFGRPTHRFLVAVDGASRLVGHSMISVKRDSEGLRFGYFFTRYVVPEHRRRGIATRLLKAAVAWFDMQGWDYLLAHTHASNSPARALFERNGFRLVDRSDTPWEAVTFRRDARVP